MINIIINGKSKVAINEPKTIYQIALAHDKKIAKTVVAAKIDHQIVDGSYTVDKDAMIEFVTTETAEGLGILRHSTAHLLAHAVKELFPEALLTIGPLVDDGFYYDFYYPKGFVEDDLSRIEVKMKELAVQDFDITRIEMSRDEALKFFENLGEIYKVKLIQDLPFDEKITLYKQGNFVDLCRGPHLANTRQLKAFKLMKLAGAYWRGDAKNEVLQRIYGTAWPDQIALDAYLKRLEEAKLRDHRVLAKKMELFHIQDDAPGMIFWHPNGWTINKTLREFLSKKLNDFGYQEINTPQILDRSLWEKSGHWDNYAKVMFTTQSENHDFAIKPMNCPCHIQVFKQGLKSYRDLPIRYAEFGSCHRNEYSGTLHGLFRVRGFVQDDGHILCTENQIASEAFNYIDQLLGVYAELGFNDVIIRLSTRPEKRVGSDAIWDKAEKALSDVLNLKGIKWELDPGEGAFYGPKIDCHLKDTLGRIWQCGTLQVDFSMPERLGAYYIEEDGSKKTPVMLHRAMLGSIERFIGILLENTAGDLPIWLAPIQAVVLNITDKHVEYAQKIASELQILGFRANADLRNAKIGFKIREHSMQRVPYQLIIGDKELESATVAVRSRDGKDLGAMKLVEFTKLLTQL